MDTALLIMAAGIGSRYGGGIKQLERVGPSGEIIIDYSIHDAIEAGFNKVVFVIRKDIEGAFRDAVGRRIEAEADKLNVGIAYAWQDPKDIPGAFPEGRVKPWGTGQAVLAAERCISEPFVVINADDYYGKQSFKKLHDFLAGGRDDDESCMAGFILRNTLSENGTVTRGICEVSPDGMLGRVTETFGLYLKDGRAVSENGEEDPSAVTSMNMWGLRPSFMNVLKEGFADFFRDIESGRLDPMTAEFLLPVFINRLLAQGRIRVRVVPTGDQWFGVTYREDRDRVVENFRRLTELGVYSKNLFSDL